MKIQRLIINILGKKNIGRLEYLLKSALADSWGGPFNGQRYRQRIFSDLITHIPFKAIVETGTYRGTTTAFLAKSDLPVYTVEYNPRYYAYAAVRFLRQRDRIHLHAGASRRFLRYLANNAHFPKSHVFFYLDAHWYEDLPLREELEIIFTKWSQAVVMIDDFQVPGTDYGYDAYGPLNMSYLEPLHYLQLSMFFPALDPQYETGAKRGCIVLCQGDSLTKMLNKIESLIPGIQTLDAQKLDIIGNSV